MSELKIGDEITTLEQLVELPIGSIIRTGAARCAQKAWMRDLETEEDDEWFETGDSTPLTSAELDDFPHTLVYLGSRP